MAKEHKDIKPPRFMVVLVDFQTNTQIQVGAPKMGDFLKKLPEKEYKPRQRFELERVIRFFDKKVKAAEKEPWPINNPTKDAIEGEVVKREIRKR